MKIRTELSYVNVIEAFTPRVLNQGSETVYLNNLLFAKILVNHLGEQMCSLGYLAFYSCHWFVAQLDPVIF